MDKKEVLYIMTHLVITLSIMALYAAFVLTGHNAEAGNMKEVIFLVMAYWFGVGSSMIGGRKDPQPTDQQKGGQA